MAGGAIPSLSLEMFTRRKTALWAAIAIAVAIGTFTAIRAFRHRALNAITGAVLRSDPDLGKQIPIANAQVFLGDGLSSGVATTTPAGLFHLKLRPGVHIGETATLHVRHPEYHPMDLNEQVSDELYVLRMAPLRSDESSSIKATMVLSDIRVRYAARSLISVDAGSATKTFEVKNTGNVPCDPHGPCSPDGRWKAAVGGASLDAGQNNSFHEARVSCIAGPCPFTKIEKDSFSAGGRYISVTVRDWSDSTMFLFEAEVTHTTSGDQVLRSFPAIFDRAMSFTLPPAAEGPSIEANLNGEDIVFPLGPTLSLSWAACSVESAKDRTQVYHCLLKPGYRFR